jgi:hypothetical protein
MHMKWWNGSAICPTESGLDPSTDSPAQPDARHRRAFIVSWLPRRFVADAVQLFAH